MWNPLNLTYTHLAVVATFGGLFILVGRISMSQDQGEDRIGWNRFGEAYGVQFVLSGILLLMASFALAFLKFEIQGTTAG